MLAGAGAAFHQMYNIEPAFGRMVMVLAVILTLWFNGESIIKIVAALTPYLLGIVFILLIYSLFTMEHSISELHEMSKN